MSCDTPATLSADPRSVSVHGFVASQFTGLTNLSMLLSVRAIALVFLVLLLVMPVGSWAVPIVEKHDLNCGDTFPCPPEIQRRVDFWVMVFREWHTNQVILHDSTRPERVYSVKQTKFTCSRKKPAKSIERERSRIKKGLLGVAKKLTQAAPKYTKDEQELLALFPSKNAKMVQRAAHNIRCQQGNRDRFLQALKRYEFYKDHILHTLRDAGLSEDILYLPFVESAYNPAAYSRVGAAGLWQIMPRTARTLGLQLSATLDERFDPVAATRAAARYLRRSTDKLTAKAREKNAAVTVSQINPFVITSYNYGVAGMWRAIDQLGPDFIAVLNKYKSPGFRTAVRNFYASFLAARYVAQNAHKYFGDFSIDNEFRYSVVVLKRPTSAGRASKVFGVSKDKLRKLNPALTRNVWKGWRLIPDGYSLHLPYKKDHWQTQVARLDALQPESPLLSGNQYVVVRGDTACEIARVHRVGCRDLIQLNNLGRRALIRVGQKLEIPENAAKATVLASKPAEKKVQVAVAETKSVDGANSSRSSSDSLNDTAAQVMPDSSRVFQQLIDNISVDVVAGRKDGKWVFSIFVEPEETMGHYADWLGIGSTRTIRNLNGIRSSRQIIVGKRIELPVKTDEQIKTFEAKRSEYHRTLVDEFQQHYQILEVQQYRVRSGDSMWDIAKNHELPYWVLTRMNPHAKSPAVGDILAIPLAKARTPSKEPPSTQGS